MAKTRAQRRLAAILASDVAGFSRMMEADEHGTLSALQEVWAARFNPAVAEHHGRIVKMMGDGSLVEFASAVDAVDCAVALQRAMVMHNAERPTAKAVQFRIGINLGDVVIDGEDIFGDGVNIAARLEAEAPVGGLLVSDAVLSQVRGKTDVAFADAGELQLKNIAAPVRTWRWSPEESPAEAPASAPAGAEEVPSIAVLPFANMSGDPEQEYFADGLVEDIITTLSKLNGLRVIARNSSFVYKGQAVDVREAARNLGVGYVLEGSVRRGGNRIRITAQLVNASDGTHVWAERYDRPVDDIFAVQDEVTLVVATEMQVKLTEGEQARLRHGTTTNVEAWTNWVQGLSYFRRQITEENLAGALKHWKKALALDPNSATLNAMIGFVHYLDARFGWWDERPAAQRKAKDFADRAMALDPNNADANITASVAMLQHARYEEAASRARHAVRLAPGSADVASLACFVLSFAGYPEEAAPLGEKAMKLSPIYPGYFIGTLGNAYRLAGRTDEAIAAFRSYHAKAPGFGLVDLVMIYQQTGRPEEASRIAKELLSIRQGFTIAAWSDTQYRVDRAGLDADISALLAAGLPMD